MYSVAKVREQKSVRRGESIRTAFWCQVPAVALLVAYVPPSFEVTVKGPSYSLQQCLRAVHYTGASRTFNRPTESTKVQSVSSNGRTSHVYPRGRRLRYSDGFCDDQL